VRLGIEVRGFPSRTAARICSKVGISTQSSDIAKDSARSSSVCGKAAHSGQGTNATDLLAPHLKQTAIVIGVSFAELLAR
jgi:hypothetical protein